MNNRQSFIWWSEAAEARKLLVPQYATKVTIHDDEAGYYLNVWWKSGAIAHLTCNEYLQSQGAVTC